MKYEVSIMSDGLIDRRNQTLIKFLVNCLIGTMFMESINASSFMKIGEKTFELLDNLVGRIGEKNVVQVITNNGSNYIFASEILFNEVL